MNSLSGRLMYWTSSLCGCRAEIEVDTEKHRMRINPCDYSHVIWSCIVAQEALLKRISQIKKIWRDEETEIDKFLVWKPNYPFMRPIIKYAKNGLFPHQAYRDWDGRGVGVQDPNDPAGTLPCYECEEPEKLMDLVQSKKCREFQIDQWAETYKQRDIYPIWPEEYFGCLGMSEELFEKLFHRKPGPTLLHIRILNKLINAGYKESYIVGGAVRNELLNLPVKDYDICTEATPEEVSKLFTNVDLVGAHFGVCIVKAEGGVYCEVATFRTDGSYLDGRHPEDVTYTKDLSEDLSRRDFTINALAKDIKGNIIDKFNGIADLDCKIIRCIGDPNKRFEEDALRILRAIRFACVLDFEIEANTKKAISNNCKLIKQVSKERITEELNKIFLANITKGINLLLDTGILKELDIEVSIELLDSLAFVPKTKTLAYYLTLLSRFGFKLSLFKYSSELLRWIEINHIYLCRLPNYKRMSLLAKKILVRHTNIYELVDLARALKFKDEYQNVLNDYEEWKTNCLLWPRPLINGFDLIEIGFIPGPKFAEILWAVEKAQLNEEINTKEEGLRIAKEIYNG
jgi:tRNA nucleotidyltransferase/poly(A) polymerase